MIALLSSLFGILTSLIPPLFKILERKMEFKHELELTKLKIEAVAAGYSFSVASEDMRSMVYEGESIRDHDAELDGGKLIDALRASVRPVLTYTFFIVFVIIKFVALLVMVNQGVNMSDAINTIWDVNTQSIFAVIISFWFGSRAFMKMEEMYDKRPTTMININKK